MLREFYLAIETLAAPGCGSVFTHIKDPASHFREKPDLYFFRYEYLFQVFGYSMIRTGRISRRPASMSKIRMIFEK